MARILLGIAIALTVLSGIFSFKTKSTVKEIREELTTVKTASSTSTATAAKAVADAKAAEEQLAAANAAKAAAEAEATTAKADAEKVKTDLQAVQSQISTKDGEINELKAQIAAVPVAPATGGADPAELEAKLKEAQTKLEEQMQVAQSLEAKSKEVEQRAAALAEEKSRRERGVNAPGLEGKVLAVNASWNFVVLSIGDRQGVAPNSTLLVKRGTSLVAKLKVTSVDPSTSIADIIPGSLPKGAYVRPGDTVIYSGS